MFKHGRVVAYIVFAIIVVAILWKIIGLKHQEPMTNVLKYDVDEIMKEYIGKENLIYVRLRTMIDNNYYYMMPMQQEKCINDTNKVCNVSNLVLININELDGETKKYAKDVENEMTICNFKKVLSEENITMNESCSMLSKKNDVECKINLQHPVDFVVSKVENLETNSETRYTLRGVNDKNISHEKLQSYYVNNKDDTSICMDAYGVDSSTQMYIVVERQNQNGGILTNMNTTFVIKFKIGSKTLTVGKCENLQCTVENKNGVSVYDKLCLYEDDTHKNVLKFETIIKKY
jgi:hypothetical protein